MHVHGGIRHRLLGVRKERDERRPRTRARQSRVAADPRLVVHGPALRPLLEEDLRPTVNLNRRSERHRLPATLPPSQRTRGRRL